MIDTGTQWVARSPVSLLERIRQATRSQHEHVESRLQGDPAGWTLAEYARLLQATHCVIAPMEAQLDRWLGDLFVAPPPANRTDRLRADLAALGRPPADVEASPLQLESRAAAFGAGYVLQGSLLGGAIITRQLRMARGSTHTPMTYIGMYGTQLGIVWSRYCDALNAFGAGATDVDGERALNAATATFSAFEWALDQLGQASE